MYKAKLRRCGVELRSATEAVGDGPESILLESMLEGLAEYYSVALAENVKRGQLGNAMKCKHNGVRTYGYDLGEDGYYHVNEEEAAVVRRMFRMYADGASMPEIAAAMPEARTKMGKPLSVGFISKSLRLEKYRGVYSYGQTRVEGGMPAIVDGELFEGVQGMLAARARRRRSTMEYLLSGKLFDAEGHRYQSSSGHGKSGRKYTYYRCPATGHQVPQHVLEDAVAKAAADVIAADDDAVEAIVAMVMAAQAEEMADSIAAADATRKRLEQNAREQSRVVDLAAKTGPSTRWPPSSGSWPTRGRSLRRRSRRWSCRAPWSTRSGRSSGCAGSWAVPTRWRPCACSWTASCSTGGRGRCASRSRSTA